MLVFCGDAIDRGPDSLSIITRLRNDPRCIYLKGNHEDMAAAALEDYESDEWFDTDSYVLWMHNGGGSTLDQLIKDKSLSDWQKYFANLPTRYTYRNQMDNLIICDHAGFTPGYDAVPLWDRDHFSQSWLAVNNFKDLVVVHGHTTVPHLQSQFFYIDKKGLLQKPTHKDQITSTALIYCSGHKIDLDLYTVVTKKVVLLNLDTFETIYFSEGETTENAG